jgi:hypothetical protein
MMIPFDATQQELPTLENSNLIRNKVICFKSYSLHRWGDDNIYGPLRVGTSTQVNCAIPGDKEMDNSKGGIHVMKVKRTLLGT